MEWKGGKYEDDIPDTALECVFSYIDNPENRSAVSLVSKKWYRLEGITRKKLTIALCYATKPSSLTRRFTRLQAINLKGKPRAAMFKLIPEDWGGYAEPWIREISVKCGCLKSIHLRRMIVTDEDIFKLVRERGHMLQVFKLDRCSGFSTIGLEAISRCCRSLKVFFLDESSVDDYGGRWLHELALHNSSLEVLNFSTSSSLVVEIADLETLVANCKSLISLKVNELFLTSISGILNSSSALQELGGFWISPINLDQQVEKTSLPKTLTSLVGLLYTGHDEGDLSVNTLFLPLAAGLRKLDLQCAFLSIEGHCELLRHCSRLLALEVLNAIGDEGLEVVANTCKDLRRLRVERGDKDVQQGFITQKGLLSVAQNCHYLEYIAMYISDIDNAALIAVGQGCPKLKDFRLVLLDEDNVISDFPLDNGVKSLLQGCPELHRFALYLKPGLLTDSGLGCIGQYGCNLKWLLLGLVGETDNGFSLLTNGCPKLERFEMRDCIFTEASIARSLLKMKTLKFVWIQGYKATKDGIDLWIMRQDPSWNVEFIPEHIAEGLQKQPSQFVAYHSLIGPRKDNPGSVICFA